jgi:hypothetical protein
METSFVQWSPTANKKASGSATSQYSFNPLHHLRLTSATWWCTPITKFVTREADREPSDLVANLFLDATIDALGTRLLPPRGSTASTATTPDLPSRLSTQERVRHTARRRTLPQTAGTALAVNVIPHPICAMVARHHHRGYRCTGPSVAPPRRRGKRWHSARYQRRRHKQCAGPYIII